MLTNYNGTDLTEIVGAVYDCIADGALWGKTLDQIRNVCNGHVATLGVIDHETSATRFSVASGAIEAIGPITNAHTSSYSFFPAIANMELDQPYMMSSIYAAQGPDSRDKWLQSKLNLEWAVPNKIDDCIWVPMVKSSRRTGHLVVMTHLSRGQITDNDLAMMAQLAPHIRRAVTIGDLFEAERDKGEVFHDIVNALHTPVFIVTADMQILFANTSGEDILAANTVLGSKQGRLEFRFELAGNAIAKAVQTAKKDEFILGPTGINVPLTKLHVPMVAHVMPLMRRDHAHRVSHNAAAAIFIGAAGRAPNPAIDAIGALFGLTPAEKTIASHIAVGRKPDEMATMNGTSINTVRTQISNLLDKTQSLDQAAVLALIKELTPPVRSH